MCGISEPTNETDSQTLISFGMQTHHHLIEATNGQFEIARGHSIGEQLDAFIGWHKVDNEVMARAAADGLLWIWR